ncbi:MAG: efflux RND transporter periplasmic adaptor subunit [Verrucomicrobiales bacterium]|nr:efflux RND transporter periplasmic adaptor subunit [Verrucomicrobiales bacterium]
MSSPSTSQGAPNRFLIVLRNLILVGVLGAAFWFGAKALREAPTLGNEGGPPPGAPQGPPPASVFVGDVAEVVTSDNRRVTGNLRAVARADVAARESGAVEKIFVDAGDVVKEGQMLIALDRRRIEAEIAEAQAAITAAKVLVTQRNAESKRAEEDFKMKTGLFQKRAVSQRELLDSEREKLVTAAQVKAASDQLNVAKSRLSLLKVRETDLKIYAPFDGRVVERHIEPGEWLAAGSSVVSLVSSGEIEAWLEVPERFSASIPEDPSALKVFAEEGKLTATATSVKRIAEVDMRSRIFQVVATLNDYEGRLVHGMSVYADLPVGEPENMLSVPSDAVVSSRVGEFLFRVIPPAANVEGAMPVAEQVPVKVQFRRDGRTFLKSSANLKAGDQIVLEGNERLRDRQPLIISRKPTDSSEEHSTGNKPETLP